MRFEEARMRSQWSSYYITPGVSLEKVRAEVHRRTELDLVSEIHFHSASVMQCNDQCELYGAERSREHVKYRGE